MSLGGRAPHGPEGRGGRTPPRISFWEGPSRNESRGVRVAGPHGGRWCISRGSPAKGRSIKSIRLTAFSKHFLCAFIPGPGVIMSGSFSQGLQENKTLHSNSLPRNTLVSTTACLLFVSGSREAQGPFRMSLLSQQVSRGCRGRREPRESHQTPATRS